MSTPTPEMKVTKSDEFSVPADEVMIVRGRNIRPIDVNWVKELKELIRQNGQTDAVICTRNKLGQFEVASDGHHRALAIKELFEEGEPIKIRCKLEPKGTSEAQRTVNQLVGNEKLQLCPMGKAEGIRRLFSYGWEPQEIAAKINKGVTYVNQYNSLNAQDRKFQSLVRLGIIKPTLAFEIIESDRVNTFLKKYDAGAYNPPVDQQLTLDAQNETEPPVLAPKKITKKDIDKSQVNSLKSFKKWAKATTTFAERIPAEKKPIYDFMVGLLNDQYSEKDIIEFFNQY